MTSKEQLLEFADEMKAHYGNGDPDYRPIYHILMMENAGKEQIRNIDGKKVRTGFPDTGITDDPGFYYDLDDAIEAVTHNVGDIRETMFDAAFILCHFPGLYGSVTTCGRMYFEWDAANDGYVQKEEPAIFQHMAY